MNPIPLIAFNGEITPWKVDDTFEMLRSNNAPGGIYVNSPGGRFEFFSVMGPAIARRGIITLSGDVGSAGVILSLLGHRRFAFSDSTFFFHEVRSIIQGNEVLICDIEEALEHQDRMRNEIREDFEEWQHRLKMAQQWFIGFIAEQTGVQPATFLDLMRQEATLSARDAIRYGIIHEILPIRMRPEFERRLV